MRSSLKYKSQRALGSTWRTYYAVFDARARKVELSKEEGSAIESAYVVSGLADVPNRNRSTPNRFDLRVSLPDKREERILSFAASSSQLKLEWLQELRKSGLEEFEWDSARLEWDSPRNGNDSFIVAGPEEEQIKNPLTSEEQSSMFGAAGGSAVSIVVAGSPKHETPKARKDNSILRFQQMVDPPSGVESNRQDEEDALSSVSEKTAQNDTERQLEDLQVRTVFSLVDAIPVNMRGTLNTKRLLYLTNSQARQFPFENMEKVLQAMEVAQPKLVINLFGSIAHNYSLCVSTSSVHWSKKTESNTLHFHDYAELNEQSLRFTDKKIAKFLEACILPLAIQTNALVICDNDDCSLSKAWSEICIVEANKRKGRLPFTVMNFTCARWVCAAARKADTITNQLAKGSPRWKARVARVENAMKNETGEERIGWFSSGQEVPAGCSHFICCEGLTKGQIDDSVLSQFKNHFVQTMAQNLPSIGIASLNAWGWSTIGSYSDYVGRGLPLLLLDSRPEPEDGYPTDIAVMEKQIEALDSLLQTHSGTYNSYLISLLAYVHQGLSARKEKLLQQSIATSGLPVQHKFIHEVIQQLQQQKTTDQDHSKDSEQAVEEIIRILMKCDSESFDRRIARGKEMLTAFEAVVTEINDVGLLDETLQRASAEWREQHRQGYHKRVELAVQLYPEYFQKLLITKDERPWCYVLTFTSAVTQDEGTFPEAKAALVSLLRSWTENMTTNGVFPDERGWQQQKYSEPPLSFFLTLTRLITSPQLYSGNLHDISAMKRQISKIAKVDRLPAGNTLELMMLLRQAWNHVDIFEDAAKWFKFATKMTYALLLLVGALVTITTVVGMNRPGIISKENIGRIVMGISLFGSFLAGFSTFLNPLQRWQQLRGAARELESEIWLFRTRSGPYQTQSDGESQQERAQRDAECLLACLETVKQHVYKSASILDTSFYSRFEAVSKNESNSRLYCHGQYENSLGTPSSGATHQEQSSLILNIGISQDRQLLDDHHSPLQPNEYLVHRVDKMFKFYQGRLPHYYKIHKACEVILLVGTITMTLTAFLDHAEWAAVVAAMTGAVTAWRAFHGTDKKMTRYSDTIGQLSSIVLWWVHLTEVDKASMANISHLVESCEHVFEAERRGWMALSIANKKMLPKAEADAKPSAQDDAGGEGSDKQRGDD
jgi:hypothetical protein